ncbi:YSIRK-type signal peptide-containing protein [Ligilactobacillus saerimneri]
MLSRNNHYLRQQRQAHTKPRYGLRKLSFGVTSVLIGVTLF